MDKNLEKYLIEAAQADKSRLSLDNPYRDTGFDDGKGRLGWVRTIPFSQIREALEEIKPLLEGKKNFIFVGMGGSINGIKPLLTLFKERSFYTLDNLDPRAVFEVIAKIENPEETMVISISKSGTTKETQLLSATLKEFFSKRLGRDQWAKRFLWLSDSSSFEKLDGLGWKGVAKAAIQFDGKTDIGGRCSSPHTLIFFLPLFLLLDKDFSGLEKIYNSFISLQPEIRKYAYSACCDCENRANAYFSPCVAGDSNLGESFSSWIVQLFQESLGSKLESLAVKTLINAGDDKLFFPLRLNLKINDSFVSLISRMYFFQVFIAYYSARKQVNFVTQNFVEKYKQQMGKLEAEGIKADNVKVMDSEGVVSEARKFIQPAHRFIEVVLYFYPQDEIKKEIKSLFEQAFPQKQLFIFVGSDWNHQSYQAAFGSKDTFYVLLIASSYKAQMLDVPDNTLSRNVNTLRVIAHATHLTLKDKSLLLSFQRRLKKRAICGNI